jgi:DNA-binding CsgD family transcriptional regulator
LMQTNRARSILGFVELALGRAEEAVAWLEPARRALADGGYKEPGLYSFLPDHVEALVQLGRFEEAAAVLEPFEETARRRGRAWAIALAQRCRGLIGAAQGDSAGALEDLERSVSGLEQAGRPFELGRSLLVLGAVARRNRRRAVARDAFRSAAELFRSVGASTWTERAEREVERVGLGARAERRLTETERRIAELVAAGRSNPEIASELFTSRKTVEAHLSRAYRKLGIRSRAELAARVGSEV